MIGYLALFVALGGTSYAAISLPAGSVGTRQLHNGAVTSRKLANGSVGAKKLDGGTIKGYVAFWAQVEADGQVNDSSPHAFVQTSPGHGLYTVSWHRLIPRRCFALVTVTGTGVQPGSYATVSLEAGPASNPKSDNATVTTFSSGVSVSEPFNVAVVCP